MYKKLYGAMYMLNIVLQSFWCLLFPIGIAFGAGWLAVRFLQWPSWCYVPLMLFGAIVGLISMCRFLISATNAMDRLEKQKANDEKEKSHGIGTVSRAEKKADADTSEKSSSEDGEDQADASEKSSSENDEDRVDAAEADLKYEKEGDSQDE